MKEVILTRGFVTLVDDDDYELVRHYKWYAHKSRQRIYAVRTVRANGKNKMVFMHRVLLNSPQGVIVDHVNRDGLDNRRTNLRECSPSQNCINRAIDNATGYRGVSKHSRGQQKWFATIRLGRKRFHLGTYNSPTLAAEAYDVAAKQLHGTFAVLNF